MDGLIALGGTLGLLLVAGAVIGLAQRRNFDVRWLLIAALLVAVNDLLLTRGYGLLPKLVPAATRNWQGQILALGATLVLASLPAFGWRRVGLTIKQRGGSLRAAVPVALLYCAFFLGIALVFGGDTSTPEDVAFQLTMPGFQEEPFYRGILLFALDRAFTARVRLLGVDWGWGAVLSCLLFGLAHAFGYGDGAFSFDPMVMALTAMPSFIAVWLRYRTGSLLLPVLLHNFGNSISLWI
ncbi:CPBP family intramembrane metalloprotease [Sphingomonas sp. BN140010]|uniref:CPBP family intramembrane metalloprotease n=1 Tax=Sphingomonas arvum TaxID=2992113 RepID=A0ABT3JGG4_9SPHN|nr:CPBP family intramembrane glutamic endopeptidase [Sphingomonas sp. BN140010]MCW3797830.1 CPBP family intramembrane metalloprotease [Sphingomonas sp. BN140010]